ncbi:MAG: Phenylalanine--tRNA ligase beta subunit [Candidatus Omnitrophica bacterium]|nr:Phenylalanine--tRNA ligase beta subunit [Candidatus Omnitrophota bacterium]
MRLPLSWLKEYVDPGLSAEALAERLSLSGTAVESVLTLEGEPVLDLEITSNRPDCLSLLGLARETAALTGRKVSEPQASARSPKGAGERIDITVEDHKLCPIYTARIITGVRVAPAPPRWAKALRLCGSRDINNVVDATNYVLFETGHPLHAFDLDKLSGRRIHVRRSRKGEKFTGIDGNLHELDDETLIIADDERPVAIAGVMGGRQTEVTASTRNVLLEAACFDPVAVRRARRKYKLNTESSYRFERGVDALGVERASERALELILEWAGGTPGVLAKRARLRPRPSKPILLRPGRVEQLLGVPVKTPRVRAVLGRLGFGVKSARAGALSVSVPSFRRDVTQEHDLIEELLRIDGFERIPTLLPPTSHQTVSDEGTARAEALDEVRNHLKALGFQEIQTYGLLSGKALAQSGYPDLSLATRVTNPLSAEQEYLRPDLACGMLQAVLYNIHRKSLSLKLFEIGQVYRSGQEQTVLGLALSGPLEENWRRKSPSSIHDLKGIVENVLSAQGQPPMDWRPAPATALLSASAEVRGAEGGVGVRLGTVRADVLKAWDIPQDLLFAEIILYDYLQARSQRKPFKAKVPPKYPSVRRDIAFVVDERIEVGSLEAAMKAAGGPSLREVRLFDEYRGKNMPAGKRSLAFALSYQKDEGTFTDEEIQSLQTHIGTELKQKFGVEYR